MDERRKELQSEESLFNASPTNYSEFLNMKKDYENMELIYDLFERQYAAREEWSRTLWTNLDPQLLISGMDQFLKEFRMLPREVKAMDIAKSLITDMKDFKNSVPLFVELKNEALRERHWKELMLKTGKEFDMAPNRYLSQNDVQIVSLE